MGAQPKLERVPLVDAELVADGLQFPEGPVAMADGSVLVGEIRAGLVTRCAPSGARETVARVGGGPNGLALAADGSLLVCNNGGLGDGKVPGSIQRVDLRTGEVATLYDSCDGERLSAPNDLVVGFRGSPSQPDGSFWFTDFAAGVIYRAAVDGSWIEAVVRGVRSPNGIGLSPAGDVVYWAETYTRRVQRRRVVSVPDGGSGRLEPAGGYDVHFVLRGTDDPWSLLAGLPGAHDLDSLAVDAAGSVCVGTLTDAGVTEISADGEDVRLHTLPEALADRAVTNVCFGGDDLRTIYLTCSQHGRLVKARWRRAGMPLVGQA